MKKEINIISCFLILLFVTATLFPQEGWLQQTSGTDNILEDVFFKDQNNGWIVGDYGTILRTTDGGSNWNSELSGTNNALLSVFFIDNNIGWSVGLNGTILKSTDGGINWSSYNTGTYNTLFSVFFIDQYNGWVAGGNTVFKTTNSGVDWTIQSIGINNYVESIYFVNQDTGWAVGNNISYGTIFKTTDGGTSWYSQYEELLFDFLSVQFITSDIGWAVGLLREGPQLPFYGTPFSTSDGGNNWTPQQFFPDIKKAFFTDENTGWVVDDLDAITGRIHKTTNGGLNWTLQFTGTPYTGLFSIFFTDANTGWAVGDYGTILRTTNGGTPALYLLSVLISDGWNMTSVPGILPIGMYVTDWWADLTGTVYKFVQGSGYSGITTTTTGEGYWMKNDGTEIYSYPALLIVVNIPINVIGGWNMFGGYEDVVPVTSLTTTPAGQIVYPIYKYTPGTGYQTAANLTPGYGYWVKVSSNCQINIPDLPVNGAQKIADYFNKDWGRINITDAAGNSYTLYAVNGEVDLNKYELPPLPPAGVFDVRYSSGRIAENINSSARGIDLRGVTYPLNVKADGMDIRLQDVTGKEINTNVKSGEEVTISNPNINKLMVYENLIPNRYALEQNYPNPFNPYTIIKFSLPEATQVSLNIYNALGQKVAELVNSKLEAGHYSFEWKANNMASGIYIYELRAGVFNSTKKMLLLK